MKFYLPPKSLKGDKVVKKIGTKGKEWDKLVKKR
jgi:hypothetical protein